MWNEQAGYAPAADMGFRLGRDDQQPMFGGGFDQTGRRQRLRAMMMMPRDQAMAMMGGGVGSMAAVPYGELIRQRGQR